VALHTCTKCGKKYSDIVTFCPVCKTPRVEGTTQAPYRGPVAGAPPPKKSEPSNVFIGLVALAVTVVVSVALLIGGGVGGGGGGGDSGGDPGGVSETTDESTCQIGRDIAGAYNVTDTITRTQERVADLYSGYGLAASPAVQSALRDWSAGMTQGNYSLAAAGVRAFGEACSAEGF
jgi:hypothetical protein